MKHSLLIVSAIATAALLSSCAAPYARFNTSVASPDGTVTKTEGHLWVPRIFAKDARSFEWRTTNIVVRYNAVSEGDPAAIEAAGAAAGAMIGEALKHAAK